MEITKEHVGHWVWHYLWGWGEIVAIGWGNRNVLVLFRLRGAHWFEPDGKAHGADRGQMLFWDVVKIQEPPKPKHVKRDA